MTLLNGCWSNCCWSQDSATVLQSETSWERPWVSSSPAEKQKLQGSRGRKTCACSSNAGAFKSLSLSWALLSSIFSWTSVSLVVFFYSKLFGTKKLFFAQNVEKLLVGGSGFAWIAALVQLNCKACEFRSKLVICTEIVVSCSAARIVGVCLWPCCFCTNTSLQFTMLPQQQQQLRLLPHLAAANGCSKRKNAATEALRHAASSSWHPMLCILWILLALLKLQKKHLQWTIRTISRDTFCNNSSPRSRRNDSTKKQAIRTSSKS